ncbi:MAG: 4-hydroxybenzoyl-CoA thioesterase [Proteobacteria bacterium]|nr:4-hydroxybenzoyl-CoA thioesterase [Pseudomonadota bacterium]
MASVLKKFTYQTKIYYEDTDAGGIVYYANYLKYFERARTELIYSLGYNHKILFEDKITVESFVRNVSNLRIEIAQNVLRDKEVMAKAIAELVIIDAAGKPKIIPQDLKEKLNSCI